MSEQPILIAVAGCSCSGKTTLARALAGRLDGVRLPLDAYYRDLSPITPAERARVNFDAPEAIEDGLLAGQLSALLAGREVDRPVYDFATHTRTTDTVRVQPRSAVILEGLFVLYWEAVRRMSRLKVFVDLDDATCLARRLDRDVRERARTAASVREQYVRTVQPMAVRYILPARAHADLVVSGAAPVEQSVVDVLCRLQPDGPKR